MSNIIYDTDQQLKSYLDTNQGQRERLCLLVLSADRRYIDVKPRHPNGGKDGGIDIEAKRDGKQVYGGVGFVNGANDSVEQIKQIKKKFGADLASALNFNESETPYCFVFFTNLNLTLSDKADLIKSATDQGITVCEIYDRERLKLILNGVEGLHIRYQILNIPLSVAEQAVFFARWGEDIQSVISEGFSNLKVSLNRLEFLAESNLPLDQFSLVVELDKKYSSVELGHARLFCDLHLHEPTENFVGAYFGITDNDTRLKQDDASKIDANKAGLNNGTLGGYWKIVANKKGKISKETFTNSHHIGYPETQRFVLSFGHSSLFRIGPYPYLKDLDECMFVIHVNESIAKRVRKITVYANSYVLRIFEKDDISIIDEMVDVESPLIFSDEELSDKWVRLMYSMGPFRIRFSEITPLRSYQAIEVKK